jgi:hypothetical protein
VQVEQESTTGVILDAGHSFGAWSASRAGERHGYAGDAKR